MSTVVDVRHLKVKIDLREVACESVNWIDLAG